MTNLSIFRPLWHPNPIRFPSPTGIRILMMPVDLRFDLGVPDQYKPLYNQLTGMIDRRFSGDLHTEPDLHIGYLTIDERKLQKGATLRHKGWHVDGYYHGSVVTG